MDGKSGLADAPETAGQDPLAGIRHALEVQGFTRHLGALVDEVAAGRVTLSIDRRPELLQQSGLFHGGVIAYLIDNATTAAAGTVCRPGERVLTAEYKLNILAPGLGARLICTAEVLRPGRSLTVVEARVQDLREDGRKLAAVALATIAVLPAAAGAVPGAA